jgi:hypothetical protein
MEIKLRKTFRTFYPGITFVGKIFAITSTVFKPEFIPDLSLLRGKSIDNRGQKIVKKFPSL